MRIYIKIFKLFTLGPSFQHCRILVLMFAIYKSWFLKVIQSTPLCLFLIFSLTSCDLKASSSLELLVNLKDTAIIL